MIRSAGVTLTANTVLTIWVQGCFPSPLACKTEFREPCPEYTTLQYSPSVVSRNWNFQKKNKVLTVGHCIFNQRGFHSALSEVESKPSRTRPPTPQRLKNIRQSKTKLLKAQFWLSLALPNRELSLLVSDKEGTRSCLLLHPLSLQVAGCVFVLLICVPACLQHCTCQLSGDSCP